MLFSSFAFLFVFLPIALIAFHVAGRMHGDRAALVELLIASAVFYGWWNPLYPVFLGISIVFNYAIALALTSNLPSKISAAPRWRRVTLWVGIAANLAALAYFKYAEFLVNNWNALTGLSLRIGHILLPLAISFVTFKQIGYLLDTSRGVNRDRDFLRYAVFVAFFPQLLAGPIVLARELIPQLGREGIWRLQPDDFAIGLTFTGFGLAKKVFADSLTPQVDSLFAASASGLTLTPIESWMAGLGVTLQLYFDFSGYSDMAIGVARLFGIRLPENFRSPFKATSMAEFWTTRWHISLSRFLRDRIYMPLTLRRGKPRASPPRRWAAIILTMTLGGIWHGAGWTYIAWGTLHGTFLAVHDAWRLLRARMGRLPLAGTVSGHALAQATTFFALVVSMIIFRAESMTSAVSLLRSFFGLSGTSLALFASPNSGPLAWWLQLVRASAFIDWLTVPLILGGLAIGFLSPNSQEVLGRYSPTLYRSGPLDAATGPAIEWAPSWRWALGIGFLWIVGVLHFYRVASFVYFQF